jgi:hypothetical protein
MVQVDVTALVAMLEDGRVDVESVGAFWQQVRRARVLGARQPVVAVPVTFHLIGELRSVAYAQLLAGPGLQEAHDHSPQANLVWHQRSSKLPPLAFAEFALPVLGVFWTGGSDVSVQALGNRLLETLVSEIPHPEWELEQQFGTSLERVFARLAEAEYLEAGATLRSTQK